MEAEITNILTELEQAFIPPSGHHALVVIDGRLTLSMQFADGFQRFYLDPGDLADIGALTAYILQARAGLE